MEHKGLVSRVEEDLERSIALGRCGRGHLPSEREMARRYGVSRTTIRGALQGLAARGLIVRHPGRKSRTVGLEQALTLESLKLALPEEGHSDPDRRRLLEGFFALKREMTIELLAACCELADEEDLTQVEGACFALREEVHWHEDRREWVRLEFELLRLAARAVDRPGHALLVQSLEKAFRGLADRVLPHLDAAAVEQWALLAFNALVERDAQALRQELSARLKAVDAALLENLCPTQEADTSSVASPAPEFSGPSEKEPLSGADRPNRYACHTSSEPARPTEGFAPKEVVTPLVPEPGCGGPEGSPAVLAWSPGDRSAGSSEVAPAPTHTLTTSAAAPSGTEFAEGKPPPAWEARELHSGKSTS